MRRIHRGGQVAPAPVPALAPAGAPAIAPAGAPAGTPSTTGTVVQVRFNVDTTGNITMLSSNNPNVKVAAAGTGKISVTTAAPLAQFKDISFSGANSTGALVPASAAQVKSNFSSPTGLVMEFSGGAKRIMPSSYTLPLMATQVKLPQALSALGNTFTIRGIGAGSGSLNILGSGLAMAGLKATTTLATVNGGFDIIFA